MLARDEEYVDEWPEQVSDVGGEKIDRVERVGDRDHRHQPESDLQRSHVIQRSHTLFVPSPAGAPRKSGFPLTMLFARLVKNTMRKRADIVLVERGFFSSRARAQAAIAAGLVSVDGVALKKASDEVAGDAPIEAEAPHPWASRGGVKLAAALDAFALDPTGLVCLDIGASTGGFTDVLLARGAAKVVAVDVGHGQLDPRLAADPRVRSLEGVDARALTAAALGETPEAIVIDVSFISQRLVLPHVLKLAGDRAWLLSLVKPQFELNRTDLVKGRVKNKAALERACATVRAAIQAEGWIVLGFIPSPILGGAGAREFLIAAHHG